VSRLNVFAFGLALAALACGRVDFDREPRVGDAALVSSRSLTARGNHACLLDGEMPVCWGHNERGQLGRGTVSMSEMPGRSLLETASRLDTGEFTTFAVDSNGTLWGWGDNEYGLVAPGTVSQMEPTPRNVDVGTALVDEAAIGQYHICVRTRDGGVWCWGSNFCSQLGDGTQTTRPLPQQVAGVAGVRALAVSDDQTCALDGAGVLRCWGAPLDDSGVCAGRQPTPAVVALPPIVHVMGSCHQNMCAVDADGGVWCWGAYTDNNFGNGITTDSLVPVAVSGFGGPQQPKAIEVGVGFSSACVLTADRRVWCWGRNTSGAVGIDEPQTFTVSTAREIAWPAALPVDELEVGCGHACLRAGSDVYCWGSNMEGRLGDGTMTDQYAPIAVPRYP